MPFSFISVFFSASSIITTSSFTTLLLFIFVTVCLGFLLQPSTKLKNLGALLPGPKPYPVVGNLPHLGINSKHFSSTLWNLADKYGPIFRLFIGKDLLVFVTDPEDIEIASQQLNKSIRTAAAGMAWIGEGLLLAPEEKWKKNKRRILPAFHIKIIQNFIPIFHQNSKKLVEEFNSFVGRPDVDVTEATAMFALRNICETAMGVSADSLSESNLYSETINELNRLFLTKIFVPFINNKFVYNLLPLGWKEKKLLRYVDSITDKVIQLRKEENRKWNLIDENYEDHADGQKKRLIFLDLLLHIQREDPSFTDKQIRDEVNTFMFAGHDTVGATLAFCLYALSKNQQIQENIYEETERILGGNHGPLELADLQEMKYLEQVIKETLRMYPPVPLIGRNASTDIKLKNGVIIPAGANVTLWLHRMHNDPKIHPNPTNFNPDNFSAENIMKRHPYSYLPFGAGLRDCIGMKYALNEAKIGLANLVRNFTFHPSDIQKELYLIQEIVLKAESGLHMKVKKRRPLED